MEGLKYIEQISKLYDGKILVMPVCRDADIEKDEIPEELYDILKQCDGIKETLTNPITNETEEIAWILYSYKMVLEESRFYKENYQTDGIVFSDDGAGNPYYITNEGKVCCYETVYGEECFVADSLADFFGGK